jgi:hypothetical protein
LSVLVGILAIAIAMACHTASKIMGSKYPAREKYGYGCKSWFRTGLDELRLRLSGLVGPCSQHSSGGKERLGRMTKAGQADF